MTALGMTGELGATGKSAILTGVVAWLLLEEAACTFLSAAAMDGFEVGRRL